MVNEQTLKALFGCMVCGSLLVCQKCIIVGANRFCVSLCDEHIGFVNADSHYYTSMPAIESGACVYQ